MQTSTSPASPKQIAFIRRLQDERGFERISDEEAADLSGGRDGSASAMIDRLLDVQRPQASDRREAPNSELRPGVYEKDGVAYIVKPTRADKDRLYAKRVVEIGGTRSTEAGTFVAVEFEYDRGAIFQLAPEDRMSGDRAKALTLRYGKCICCGRDLKAGESVEQGIGPVCVKNSPELVEERKAIKARARAEAKAAQGDGMAEVRRQERRDAQVQADAEAMGPDPETDLVALARQIEGEPVGESDEANVPDPFDEALDRVESREAAPTPYSVLLAINEPEVAVTARWSVRAYSEDEAVETATDLAEERFGGNGSWQVERVEVAR